MKVPVKKVWLLEHPTSMYVEDVKELAMKSGLKIIDAKFAKEVNPEFVAKETPKVTKKEVKKPAKK